jgi:ADP-heptose:LPS heptosyltransferase
MNKVHERPATSDPLKILFFQNGSLGDHLVTLPSIWTIREHFPHARFFLLSNVSVKGSKVASTDVFQGSGIFEKIFVYPENNTWRDQLFRWLGFVMIFLKLKREHIDILVFLVPSKWTQERINRSLKFFHWLRIPQIIGDRGFPTFPIRSKTQSMPHCSKEADLLLLRLKASGLQIPDANAGNTSLNLKAQEFLAFQTMQSQWRSDEGRRWVAIGPSANYFLKVWPEDRYDAVMAYLIRTYAIWPVTFGSKADQALGERLISKWKCGYNLAGKVSVRLAAVALQRCWFYCGNDTGTMHLAASVGIPCVAVFSSRDYPGLWYPYGSQHLVLRTSVPCEVCWLEECLEYQKKCILSITVDQVIQACESVIHRTGIASK